MRDARSLFLLLFLWGTLAAPWEVSAEDTKKKVLFIAGRPSHGWASHEHNAGCILLAKYLQAGMPNFEVNVVSNGWPEDEKVFDGVDAIVMYSDGGGGHMVKPHLEFVDKLAKKGIGIVCIHYAVEVPKGPSGEKFLDWIGGYFETHWSVNPHWTANFETLPDHPITRGVRPFKIQDEWYYHMRFREGMQGVTPILTALPPDTTLQRRDGAHSGNPHVRKAIANKEPQHVAWASERADGGRGFGFTGGHSHWNWGDDNFRKVVLNAIVWVAKGEVPAEGVESPTPTQDQLEENQDFPNPKKKTANSSQSVVEALDGLEVAQGLEAKIFAAEPMMLSPTNIDVDHLGRVWVCEVVNYRGRNGERPDGDRILILEDTTGDGVADKSTVFYQGRDIDSALGICVLGNKVIVSVAPHVFVFTDENGDGKADKKEILFSKVGTPQHDHSTHAFVFGPDGKLYWNFGNTGRHVHDKDGKIVVDMAGNAVNDQRNPYQEGMVFRCNLDGSEFETLGWNFRNNYEVAVDSFGGLWQSDNDDDGNRACRIDYVMEFGNFGYKDEFTGASWKTPRAGMHPEIPYRHWHNNDPGVVPTLLVTGAGSPTGICVYEGRLLPKIFWDQLIHCDAGPRIVRAYPVKKNGAGYQAETVNILEGTSDKWFRPSDVCVAPDGSLMVADWHDPGVGGHRMADVEKGRVIRIAPPGVDYKAPKLDVSTVEGAIEGLKSPNLSARYVAWTALNAQGKKAENALLDLYKNSDNPRHRARALWLLGKMEGRGAETVALGLKDSAPDLRVTSLRLARQLKLDVIPLVASLTNDSSSEVLRECAIALRHHSSPEAPQLWARLASRHDGSDRWYLEALGIAADRQWDAFHGAWLKEAGDNWNTPTGRDLAWRSRSAAAIPLLAKIVADSRTTSAEIPRYFRAFDFHREAGSQPAKQAALMSLLNVDHRAKKEIRKFALERLGNVELDNHPELKEVVHDSLRDWKDPRDFLFLVDKFNLADRYPLVLELAQKQPDEQIGVEAIRLLLAKNQLDLIRQGFANADPQVAANTVRAVGNSADGQIMSLLLPILKDTKQADQLRRESLRALASTRNGALELIEMAKANQIEPELKAAVALPLNTAPWKVVQEEAQKLFPLPAVKGEDNPPSLVELLKAPGDATQGKIVFDTVGSCIKCHKVNGEGKDVGPDLSEIGKKLSREALFESILFPSAAISHNYETYAILTTSGNVVTGILTSQTADEVTIKSADAISRTFKRSEIDEIVKQKISLMPADLQKTLNKQDLLNVVEYMQTLKQAQPTQISGK